MLLFWFSKINTAEQSKIGLLTQPTMTEATNVPPSSSLWWNLFWAGDFLPLSLTAGWNLASIFSLWFTFIQYSSTTTVTGGILFSVYPTVLFLWIRHFTDTWREFHYTWHKCPLELKDELIGILWSKAQGRRTLTNGILAVTLLKKWLC